MNTSTTSMQVLVKRGSVRQQVSLQCTLCQYQFRSPKILPCYHSFCEACLFAVVTKSSTKTDAGTRVISCPICRNLVEIQKGGVHTLQTNYVLAAQIIRLNLNNVSAPDCCLCAQRRKATDDPVPASLKCWECDKFLCNKCVEVHKGLLKFHTLIQLCQAAPPKVVRYSYCGKHPDEQLRFYCVKCEENICRDCRMTTHAEIGHRTRDLSDLQQVAKELVCKVNDIIIENFIPVVDANVQFFKRQFEDKSAAKPAMIAAIKGREKILLKLVYEATKDALQHLDDTIKQTEEESRQYQDCLSRMKSETEFNELVIQSGGEAEVMQAAINVMAYTSPKNPQASLVNIVNLKQELVWDRKDTMPFGQGPGKPKDQPVNYTLRDWKEFADNYLGRVNLHKIKLTLALNQVNEEANLLKCFRKIGLLVDAYKKHYTAYATK